MYIFAGMIVENSGSPKRSCNYCITQRSVENKLKSMRVFMRNCDWVGPWEPGIAQLPNQSTS